MNSSSPDRSVQPPIKTENIKRPMIWFVASILITRRASSTYTYYYSYPWLDLFKSKHQNLNNVSIFYLMLSIIECTMKYIISVWLTHTSHRRVACVHSSTTVDLSIVQKVLIKWLKVLCWMFYNVLYKHTLNTLSQYIVFQVD